LDEGRWEVDPGVDGSEDVGEEFFVSGVFETASFTL
jgi:hypothetical protein